MPLTDTFIKALRHDPSKSAGSKHSDGHGLYLHVKESGKYWRRRTALQASRRRFAPGVYPTVGLAQARRRRDEAREQLASSIDPSLAKQVQKLALAYAQGEHFEAVVREFHGVKSGAWSDTYAEKWLRNMSK
ncbi:Arm DNA-binding domain-containing protein [Delftia sp.]|uniref:Arm DNA-binding domain-containing protein n=1 Tax=Delftia sp. TaxID=1886637 RepID=UPI00259D2013|nr:Arm DNA-binding domain-containing protein [Delftia sp.]